MIILENKPTATASALEKKISTDGEMGAKHLSIDVETCFADKKAISLVQSLWKPAGNSKTAIDIEEEYKEAIENATTPAQKEKASDKKSEALQKIADRKTEAYEKIERDSALLDGAPIGLVCVVTESVNAIFSSVPEKKKWDGKINKLKLNIYRDKNERNMLLTLREWLDARSLAQSIVIGFNIFYFDLPKLRNAYVRHRLAMPMLFRPEARQIGVEIYDVMRNFLRYFSPENANEKYISLAEVETRLGLPLYKDKVSGAEIPGLLKAGKVKEAMTYNFLDTVGTYSSFLAMTGQIEENGNK